MASSSNNRIYTRLQLDISEFVRNMQQAGQITEQQASRIEQDMQRVQRALSRSNSRGRGGFGGLTDALAGQVKSFVAWGAVIGSTTALVKDIVSTTAEFERSLSGLSALTGATGDDLEYIRRQAISLSTQSELSAKEIVEAMKLIGGARAELLECTDGLAAVTKAVVTLSQASESSLEDAARAVTGALGQFGKGAEYAAAYVNVLAAGAAEGAAEVPYLQAAVERAGSQAANAGMSFEQLVAVIEGIAPKFTSAETAGTQLRNVLQTLESQADDKLKPSVVGIHDALDNLAKKELSTKEMTELFGKANTNMADALIKARGDIRELEKAVTDTKTAEEQAQTVTDNLQGAVAQLSNEWDAFVLTLNRSDGVLAGVVRWVSSLVTKVRELMQTAKEAQEAASTDAASSYIEEVNEALRLREEGRYVDEVTGKTVKNTRKEALEEEIKTAETAIKIYTELRDTYEAHVKEQSGGRYVTDRETGELVDTKAVAPGISDFMMAQRGVTSSLQRQYNKDMQALAMFSKQADAMGTTADEYKDALARLEASVRVKEYLTQLLAQTTVAEDDTNAAPTTPTPDPAELEKERKARLKALETLGDALTKGREELAKAEIDALEEGEEKKRLALANEWEKEQKKVKELREKAEQAARDAGKDGLTEEQAAMFERLGEAVDEKYLRKFRELEEEIRATGEAADEASGGLGHYREVLDGLFDTLEQLPGAVTEEDWEAVFDALADGLSKLSAEEQAAARSTGLLEQAIESQGLSIQSTAKAWAQQTAELKRMTAAYKAAQASGMFSDGEVAALGSAVKEQQANYALDAAGTVNDAFASIGDLAGDLGLDGLSDALGDATGFISSLIGTIQAVMSVIQMIQGIIGGTQVATESANTAALIANTTALGLLNSTMLANTAVSAIPFLQRGGIVGRYEQGGRIRGPHTTGDRLLARVNAGEMVLTRTDQSRLLASLRGGMGGGSGTTTVRGEDIYLSLSAYMKRTGKRISY